MAFGCKPKKNHQCNAPMQCADFDFDLLTLTSMGQIMKMELGLRMSTNAAKFEPQKWFTLRNFCFSGLFIESLG